MKKSFITLLLTSCSLLTNIYAQDYHQDSLTIRQFSNEILTRGKCYDDLTYLCKKIGHRLSGSPQADAAVAWGKQTLIDAGCDTVWLQPTVVPVWTRGNETLHIKVGSAWESVKMLSLGNSQGTDGVDVIGDIVLVADLDAFAQMKDEAIKDKIIFFNYPFRQDFVVTFNGYGDAVKYRWKAVSEAAKRGAKAVMIRSVGTDMEDRPHTGMTSYGDAPRIPAIAIGAKEADRLAKLLKQQQLQGKINSKCGMNGTQLSYNVIGELRGRERPNEYIVVSGHLDSWDVGEGAHDDGAGCVQSIEVVRTLKRLKIAPRHTIRAILYMNEENGVAGGKAYADSAERRKEHHILAMESDAGGFTPRGIGCECADSVRNKIKAWTPLFLPYGVYDFDTEEGGVDIGPLRRLGVPLSGLIPDSQRYFEYHHTEADVLEAVNHRELKLGAVVMTAFIYLVDKYF